MLILESPSLCLFASTSTCTVWLQMRTTNTGIKYMFCCRTILLSDGSYTLWLFYIGKAHLNSLKSVCFLQICIFIWLSCNVSQKITEILYLDIIHIVGDLLCNVLSVTLPFLAFKRMMGWHYCYSSEKWYQPHVTSKRYVSVVVWSSS